MTSEAFIFVSDDTKHDSHAVQHFNGIMMKHLNEQHTTPFQKVVFFSDGVPAQYKNKTAFADLSCTEEDVGVSAEHHFFGTRHGKGPCDREFGTLKKAVKMQVKCRRADIDSAQVCVCVNRGHSQRQSQEHSSEASLENKTAALCQYGAAICRFVQGEKLLLWFLPWRRSGRDVCHVRHHWRLERCSPSKGPKGKATEQQGLCSYA